MKINKKVLASIFVIALLALGLGYGTLAYYSDTEESTGNVFQSGTIDLMLAGDLPFVFYDIKPSEELAPVNVTFKNIGQNPGYLYNKITYVNNDKAENPTDLTADEFAALIYVEAVNYTHYTDWEIGGWGWGGTSDDLPNWLSMDANSDGFVSLYEINQVGWLPYDINDPEEPLIAGDAGSWIITFHMADSLVGRTWGVGDPTEDLEFDVLDNATQADGINMTWTAVLNQLPETLP